MKKILSLILVAALLCALLPVLPASADVVLPPDEFGENTVSGTCGENLTWTLDLDTGVLEITGTGEMPWWYDGWEYPWCSYRESIKTAIIGDGITSVGRCAFYEHTELAGVEIPNSVTTIDYRAFYGCTGLTDVTIPDSVTSILSDAFCYTGLTSVTIPNGITSICDGTFGGCRNLTSVAIPDSVTSIGTSAFLSCRGLTSVTIPDSVTSIGSLAFSYCSGLTNITLSNSVTNISRETFIGCTSLKSVTIPEGVTTIGFKAFEDCTELTSLSLPGSLTRIEYKAFLRCNSLADLYYPGTRSEWNKIAIESDNNALSKAKQHFREEPERLEFVDVSYDAWYYNAAKYAVDNKLMTGMSERVFAPNDPMTRAMLVTVLWRYENCPEAKASSFTDLTADWYKDAVAWAAENGIVGGVGNGKFDPNGNITREQMAAILYRYANKKGFDTSKRGDLSKFPDAGKVSEWAKEPIAWAVAEGIIGGSDGKLLPQGNATRAQVATILMRFIEGVAKK